ncbi:MAG TPA: aminotransferase class III-fold pyridoxal phosphate-dependent enzyme [Steroidobacteraceae bacterium]|nr:aminotransferase class III-fold pyridoxal phosphate-dependent enzyme [Steroidobacteraceae bacterium]
MTDPLAVALEAAQTRHRVRHPQSARCHELARRHLPGGSTRSAIDFPPFPLTFREGRDQWLTDVDGIEYLDLLGEYSAGLYGHSEPRIRDAIARAVADGLVLGGRNCYEGLLAAALCERFPSLELVRFTNSGTEANLMALATVRARAGVVRRGVLVFEGGYHGGVFNFRRQHGALNIDFDWCLGHYNEIERTRELLRARGDELAVVLIEPMQGGGCIPARPQFLEMLRAECSALGVVLIFDEVMTSRLSRGGLQERLRIRPDLTTFGKYLGGGASFGAFGGRRDLMERFDASRPDALEHAGTFNNNVISMAAGLAGLTEVYTESALERLNALGDTLRERLNAVALERAAPLEATGIGSLIGLHWRVAAGDARTRIEALFHLDMIERGFYLGRRGYIALSLPTTAADLERFVGAVDDFLKQHASLAA